MNSRRPAPPSGVRPRPGASSRFGRLARTHASMAAGDAAMAVALADSVLFSLDADAARGRVLLFLGISFVPFLFVAPLIGPAIDRMAGGRRLVIQMITLVRVSLSIAMAFNADSLLLFPLAFVAMVAQKTYAISKSALVPTVVRSEAELVEANSKLGLISGLVGAAAVIPAGILQKTIGATATLLYAAVIFGVAFVAANRLPREVIATREAGADETVELHADRVVLASNAMMLLRAGVGFTFFHLFFWFRAQDAGLVWFGLSLGFASLLTMGGNASAPLIRDRLREETMLVAALVVVAAAGLGTAFLGGVVSGMLLAGSVNFAAAIGRLAFEAIVQRDAPDANRGRAFAQFETRFQLGWVGAGVIPVLVSMPGRLGFVIVGLAATAAAVTYLAGTKAVELGRAIPRPLARLGLTRRPSRTTTRAGSRRSSPARGATPRRPASPRAAASPDRPSAAPVGRGAARQGPSGPAPAAAGTPGAPPPPPPPPPGRSRGGRLRASRNAGRSSRGGASGLTGGGAPLRPPVPPTSPPDGRSRS